MARADENGQVPVATCENRDPWGTPSTVGAFLPVFAAQVNADNPTGTYEGKCFKEIKFEYEAVSDTSFNINVTTS